MRAAFILLLNLSLTLGIGTTARAQENSPADAAIKTSTPVVAPSTLPADANTSSKSFIRFKLSERASKRTKPETYMVVRFSCEPLRYSAWIVNKKSGVNGDVTQIKFDDQAVLKVSAFKQNGKTLVLEDAWGESEKAVIDRLRVTKNIEISYHTKVTAIHRASFYVGEISKDISAAEAACFAD
jgi:hypothetical protein